MNRIFFFVVFCVFCVGISAQSSASTPDTVFNGDTIYRDRTVEKVMYVYGMPEHYFAGGVFGDEVLAAISSVPNSEMPTFSTGGGVFFQYFRQYWLFDCSLGYRHYMRSFSNIYNSSSARFETVTSTDTVSWYNIYYDTEPEQVYITRQQTYDTVIVSQSSHTVRHTNNYHILELPLSVGRQIKYGFLCADVKAGVVPRYIFSEPEDNKLNTQLNLSLPETIYTNDWGLDVSAAVSLRYLLTFQTILSLDVFGRYSAVPFTRSSAGYRARIASAGLRLGLSYIISEK